MKKNLFMMIALVALVMFSCKENPYIGGPGEDNPQIPDTIPVLIPDTDGIEISIDSAYKIVDALPANATSQEIYKIRGEISLVKTNPFLIPSTYTNVDFEIIPIGATNTNKKVVAYRSWGLNNVAFRNRSQVPLAGTIATFRGHLTKYNNAPELKGYDNSEHCFITSWENPTFITSPLPSCSAPEEGELSCTQAADTAKLGRSKKYQTKGKVVGMLEFSTGYGNAQILITDGQKTLLAYRAWAAAGNKKFTSKDQLMIGDEITIEGMLTTYNNFPQIANGCYLVKSNNPNWQAQFQPQQ